MTKYIRSKRK